MALDLRISFQCEPSRNDLESENMEFKPTQGTAVQREEGISECSSTQLNSFQNSNNSFAKQELQRLHEFFHSWLQPEKHSKDEIISQLVLEQFIISGHCSDRSTLKEKWESNGRNLEKLMEELTDDCMKPPVFVHVHMQGQEALFSENMPLKEVIVHLTKQLSAGTPTGENIKTPFQTPQYTAQETGQGDEDKEDSHIFLKIHQVNYSVNSQGNQVSSLHILQQGNCLGPEEEGVSYENPHNTSRAGLGTSRSQEGSLQRPSYHDVPKEVKSRFLLEPDQISPEPIPTHQSIKRNSSCEGERERFNRAPKFYKCGECTKIFRYPSHLLAHQRRHRNERPFVCAECHKRFFQASDLHVHQMIHRREKPFTCSMCGKSFSHKTNLQAHERIHTGEKPYMCSFCQRSYRQSSTYHRHLRIHQKVTLKCFPSIPEDSSATALM
ncbi:PREDICTED: zinc finger and SCAN domain-containing protein 4 [Galeopterus variegatus]|uniref:Zinc finger and SCAN domain-containing protein 4 n=1 Tax=Galeopterus variegatus TaxID=482537 RepID=A0ABM0S8K4_GALVR|nr:PREDICTED: zinc finger and SCAN domain-containing protein 4 [Galeopterus variegatus]XP_008589195.1 PREDICTED: zinc finger and SCAN domain-containing protein 4 [Galeopterus variegatus]